MNPWMLAMASVGGLAAGALGQSVAKWTIIEGGTADGDYIIQDGHGESDITFKFGIDLTPSPGEMTGDGATVVGFGSVIANFIGTENWGTGTVTWTMNPDLIFLTGDLTHKDGATQDLLDMNAGQIPGFGPFTSADPIWIVTVNWATTDFSSRHVHADIDTQDGDTVQVYIKKGITFEEPQTWPVPDANFGFDVGEIPGPGTGAVMLAGAVGVMRRRR